MKAPRLNTIPNMAAPGGTGAGAATALGPRTSSSVSAAWRVTTSPQWASATDMNMASFAVSVSQTMSTSVDHDARFVNLNNSIARFIDPSDEPGPGNSPPGAVPAAVSARLASG